jgi:hypothetical protein
MGDVDGVVIGEIGEDFSDVDVAVADETDEEFNDVDVATADKTDGELGDVDVADEISILDGVDAATVDEIWLAVVVSTADVLLPKDEDRDEVATAPVKAAVDEPTAALEPLVATPSSLPARILSSLNGRPSPNFG